MPAVESSTPIVATTIDQHPGAYEVWNKPDSILNYDPAEIRNRQKSPHPEANPLASGVAGTQRGDEGKGDEVNSEVETAAENGIYGTAVKVGGGGGTGHTFHPKDGPQDGLVFSVLPAAVHEKWKQVVGRAVLVKPEKMIGEIKTMADAGYNTSPERIAVDPGAFLSWEGYSELDRAEEELRAGQGKAIGTTKNGVGPSASTYTARQGMKMGDLLLSDASLLEKVIPEVDRVNRQLRALDSNKHYDPHDIARQFREFRDALGPYIRDTFQPVRLAMFHNDPLALETSQAHGLGVDTGIIRSKASVDTSFGPFARRYQLNEKRIKYKTGILKLVETAVGNHILYAPIPQEFHTAIYERTAQRGRPEEGAVSHRKREIQWPQIPLIKAAIETMGLNGLVVKKIDVLDKLPYIDFGIEYLFPDGTSSDVYDPENPWMLDEKTTMKTIRMPGWLRPTVGITNYEDLPVELKRVIGVLEYLTGVPVVGVGNGPYIHEKIKRPGYPFLP